MKYTTEELFNAINANVYLKRNVDPDRASENTRYHTDEDEGDDKLATTLMTRIMLRSGYSMKQIQTELTVGDIRFEGIREHLSEVMKRPEANPVNRRFHLKLTLVENYLILNVMKAAKVTDLTRNQLFNT